MVKQDKNGTNRTNETGDTAAVSIPMSLEAQAVLKSQCEFYNMTEGELVEMALVQLAERSELIDRREQALQRMRQADSLTRSMRGLMH